MYSTRRRCVRQDIQSRKAPSVAGVQHLPISRQAIVIVLIFLKIGSCTYGLIHNIYLESIDFINKQMMVKKGFHSTRSTLSTHDLS